MKKDQGFGVVVTVILSLCIILTFSIKTETYFVSSKNTPFEKKASADESISIKNDISTSTSTDHTASSTLVFVGDIMLGRNVETLMDTYGDDYPFRSIYSYLFNADSVIANLEGPIVDPHTKTPNGSFQFNFDPRIASVLPHYNIDIVNLANNHTYDYGKANFDFTGATLDKANVQHFGNPFEVANTYTLNTSVNSVPMTFVGFNFTNPHFDISAAVALVQAIPKDKKGIYIVEVHGGTEYDLHSNQAQEDFYRKLIDAGATMVIAHHPHVVQEIEQYNGKFIFYSLGNFIFDQYFSKDVEQGLTLKMHIDETTISIGLNPIQSMDSQPRLMIGDEKNDFLEALASRSSSGLQEAINSGSLSQPR